MWGLGAVAGTPAVPADLRASAGRLLDDLAAHVPTLAADGRREAGLRTAAYALLGLACAGRREAAVPLVARLDRALRTTTAEDPAWRWFEPELTYDNARLPQALLAGAALTGDTGAATRALDALEWYAGHLRLADGPLRCVGNVWHRRDDDPAAWNAEDGDEQPLDAAAVAEAFVEAWRYRAARTDAAHAASGLSWFLGRNRVGARMYVDRTGACHDGLSPSWVNGNQGAESTLAYYQALLALVRAGLATLPGAGGQPQGATVASGSGRTLAGRVTTTRPAVTDRSSTQRVRPAGAAPTGPTGPAGHRARTTEGHTDAL